MTGDKMVTGEGSRPEGTSSTRTAMVDETAKARDVATTHEHRQTEGEVSVAETVIGDRETVDAFSETDDGLIHFGPPTPLKPVPARPTDQPGRLLEHVPDIAIDWLDVTSGNVRAVSVRGHNHRHFGQVREDSYAFHAFDDYVAIAVADGVGSASASHLGSAIVARHAVIATRLLDRVRDVGAEPTTETLEELADVLTYEATSRDLEPSDLATNLILAVIPTKPDHEGIFDVVLARIGDPVVWRRSEDGWTACRATDDHAKGELDKESGGPVSTITQALPTHTEALVWREAFIAGDVLALASDGVGNIVRLNGAFAHELSALWRKSAPAPAVLLKLLDATVKSFGDDRTFVGYRFS